MSGNAAEKHLKQGHSIWSFQCPELLQNIDISHFCSGNTTWSCGSTPGKCRRRYTIICLLVKKHFREWCVGRDIVHAAVCIVGIYIGTESSRE